MKRPRGPVRAPWIGTWLLLAGCASTRHEPPPEVVPQPPEVTTAEVAEQDEAAREQLAEEAAERAQPAAGEESLPGADLPVIAGPRPAAGAAGSAPAPPPLAGARDTAREQRRYRPTGSSIEEIRSLRAAAPPPLDFRQRLDHAHDRIYAWMQSRVEAMDHGLAAENRPLQPVPAAPFRLALVGEAIDRTGATELGLDANFDIALNLPNIERRLRIFVTSGELDESPRSEREDQNLSAGLRYQVLNFLDFDLGVRVDKAPVAFAALKWSREIPLGRWDFYPFAKLFAETKESVGYAAATTFDRWWGRDLLRTSTYAKWRADRSRTQWSQTLVYARANQLIVPDRYGSYPRATDIGRGWGVRLLAGGETAHSVDEYESAIFYRRPTRTRWLYWSVEPLVRWDRKYDWSADPGIRIGVEALFWDLARRPR